MKNVICLLSAVFVCASISFAQDGVEYIPSEINTGDTPGCYSFVPKFDESLDNYLSVKVGGGADVVLKIMNHQTNACVRYVFINSGDEFLIRNIPPGIYYLKIAFGNEWSVSGTDEACVGKFMSDSDYRIGNDLLDFNPVSDVNGMQIPSYRLYLEKISADKKNEYETENISEEEFQN